MTQALVFLNGALPIQVYNKRPPYKRDKFDRELYQLQENDSRIKGWAGGMTCVLNGLSVLGGKKQICNIKYKILCIYQGDDGKNGRFFS